MNHTNPTTSCTTSCTTSSTQPGVGVRGLIVFDGGCGACAATIGRRHAFFARYGFTVAPYQQPWTQQLLGLDAATLAQAIHLRTPDGAVVRGIDAFRVVAAAIWWLTPLAWLLGIRPLRPLFEAAYDFIAKRRRSISCACGLRPYTAGLPGDPTPVAHTQGPDSSQEGPHCTK
jgi:predicted DCC family thiol-disulfide oxidoreductase YuxK